MPLVHPAELLQRVTALLEDTGPLHTSCGLGFVDDEPARVDRAVAELTKATGWRCLDLRAADADEAATQISALAPTAPALVIAARAEATPRPLLDLVRAATDRAAEIHMEGRPVLERRTDQSVAVVLVDAPSLEGLAREWARVPYWDFVA